MSVTDMKHPIQYALTYPERQPGCLPSLDLAGLGSLGFEEPDFDRFPCLGLAFEALKAGGTMPAVLNAANEISVNAFLQKKIGFDDIATINRSVMLRHPVGPADTIEKLHTVDTWARSAAAKLVADATNAAIAA